MLRGTKAPHPTRNDTTPGLTGGRAAFYTYGADAMNPDRRQVSYKHPHRRAHVRSLNHAIRLTRDALSAYFGRHRSPDSNAATQRADSDAALACLTDAHNARTLSYSI
jgi:hypothetical protein